MLVLALRVNQSYLWLPCLADLVHAVQGCFTVGEDGTQVGWGP